MTTPGPRSLGVRDALSHHEPVGFEDASRAAPLIPRGRPLTYGEQERCFAVEAPRNLARLPFAPGMAHEIKLRPRAYVFGKHFGSKRVGHPVALGEARCGARRRGENGFIDEARRPSAHAPNGLAARVRSHSVERSVAVSDVLIPDATPHRGRRRPCRRIGSRRLHASDPVPHHFGRTEARRLLLLSVSATHRLGRQRSRQ